MERFCKEHKIRRTLSLILSVIVVCTLLTGLDFGFIKQDTKVSAADKDNPIISTMSKYKNTDYTFLKGFDFGKKNNVSESAVLNIDTANDLKACNDVRLKPGKYVVTNGYSLSDDQGGATYLIDSKNSGKGTITLANGLFANLVPDVMVDSEGIKWMVVNVKQFGAVGDAVSDDTTALNDALDFATNKRIINECDRTILYIPSGEYKACNQLYSYEQYVNVVGDGDDSIIFTDNDYKRDSSYSEPFMECQGSIYAFYGHFKLEAREVNLTKYMRQMMMYYCTDVYLYDITYYIPQEAWSGNYYQDKQYTNLTIYAGNKQITVDDCLMYQMSGTYRGANMGIMDFYSTGTENITVMNCEFHDNARDEQFGIFSVSGKPKSYVKNVDFINNTVYTYTTPYKNIHGHRTMCFTIAYGDNNVSDINISGNHFISEVDSKFMTFGSVKDCRIKNNIFEFKASYGAGGALFDSSNSSDENIAIDGNEFFLSYTYENKNYTKQLSTGHLTFSNNRFVTDLAIWKMVESPSMYTNNDFISLRPFGNCGAATTFNNNSVTLYGGHSSNDNGIFGNWSGSCDNLSFCNNTINDYSYNNGPKNKKPFDRLFTLVGISEDNPFTAKEVYFNNNTYECPNYGYQNESDTMMICWLRNNYYIDKFECKDNILQGAKSGWFSTAEYDLSDNTMIPFNRNSAEKELVSSVVIGKDGNICNDITVFGDSVSLSSIVKVADIVDEAGNIISEKEVSDREIKWLTSIESIATVDNGVVTRHDYGDVCVYAVATDGSGAYSRITIHFVKSEAKNISVEKDTIEMQPNHIHDIMYQVMPYPYASQVLEWSTSNSNVVEVTTDGIVTSKSVGEADITCVTTDGTNISKTIHINVTEPTVVKIDIDRTYDVLEPSDIGKKIQLNVTGYLPDNAVNKGVGSYESTNENVAVVDNNGIITITGIGACHIRVYSLDKSCYANYNIYVKPTAMQNLTVMPSKDKAVVSWDKMTEASGYNLYRKKEGDTEWTCISKYTPTKNTTYYDGYNGGLLDSDTTYYYYITAYVTGYDTGMRVDYEGIPSNVIIAKTNTKEIPTEIIPNITNLSVVINKGATLYVRVNPNGAEFEGLNWSVDNSELAHIKNSSKTTCEFVGDKLGFGKVVISEDTSGVSRTLPIGVVPAYQVKELEAVSDYNNISVRWKAIDDENDIDGYVITQGINETYIPLSELSKSKFTNGTECYEYIDFAKEFGKTFSYTVTPYIENEGYKYKCLKSNNTSCELPQYVAVNSITAQDEYVININENRTIQITSEPVDATRAEFIWKSKDSSIADVEAIGKTSAVITGKKTGITKLDIIANDEDCYFISPKIVVVPEMTDYFIAENKDLRKVKLTWNALSGVSGYNIYKKTDKESNWQLLTSTTNALYEDSDFEYSTNYNYKVCGYVRDGSKIYEGQFLETSIKTSDKPQDKKSHVPVFDITGGNYNSALQIKFTNIPENTAIYYTIDSETPTTDSLKYNGLFTLPGVMGNTVSYTVKAIAIEEGCMASDVVTETYVITLKNNTANNEDNSNNNNSNVTEDVNDGNNSVDNNHEDMSNTIKDENNGNTDSLNKNQTDKQETISKSENLSNHNTPGTGDKIFSYGVIFLSSMGIIGVISSSVIKKKKVIK